MSVIPHIRSLVPRYVPLDSFTDVTLPANATTELTFEYPQEAKGHSARRIVAFIAGRRNNDNGATLNSATFYNGTNSISATIHDQATAGDGSANNSVFGAIISAIVPSNNYNKLRLTMGGGCDEACVAVLAIYNKTDIIPGIGNVVATHSSLSSWAISGDTEPSENFLVMIGGFSVGGPFTWDKGVELWDLEGPSVCLCVAIEDPPPSEVSRTYNVTYDSSMTASCIGAIAFN